MRGNRPVRDTRFLRLSESEKEMDIEGGDKGRALSIPKILDAHEEKFIKYLLNLHDATHGDVIDMDKLKDAIGLLQHMNEENQYDYMKALLRPEVSKGSKIPTVMPVPSSSFQLHNSLIISTNATGNAEFLFNPYYLATSGASSTFYLNNDVSLTGSASSNFFKSTAIGQVIPAVYNEFRVVSASVVVKYVGRLDIVQGVVGGAIVFDQNLTATDSVASTVNSSLAKYGDFNLAMDSYFTQENLMLNGIRELYFPLDSTFDQYLPVNQTKTGFGFLVYILGGVPSSAYYKVDIFVNYECLADSAFLNYIPTTACDQRYSADDRSSAVAAVQREPITPESAGRELAIYSGGQSSIWDVLKKGLGKFIPSAVNLAANFLPGGKVLAPLLNSALTNMTGY